MTDFITRLDENVSQIQSDTELGSGTQRVAAITVHSLRGLSREQALEQLNAALVPAEGAYRDWLTQAIAIVSAT